MADKQILICPKCKSQLLVDGKPIGASKPEMMITSSLVPRQPSDGDYNFCEECDSISVFTTENGKLELRLPTDIETLVLAKHFS